MKLGVIIAVRHFTASGQVSQLAAKARDDTFAKLFAGEGGVFHQIPKAVPEPQRLTTFLEGHGVCAMV